MTTQTAPQTARRPEWIDKAATSIAEMVQRGETAAVRQAAAVKNAGEQARERVAEDAALARQQMHQTQQKIAAVIHKHFEESKPAR